MFRTVALILVVAMSFAFSIQAQQPPVSPVEKEHQWLKKFVGQWQCSNESVAVANMPAMKCEGKMQCTMLGEYWVVNRLETDMGGAIMNGIQTIGYDPKKKKYVGTWVDSMMNHMWQYEGTVDESGKKLSLEAIGPNFMAEGKMTKFRDSYEFKSAEEMISTSEMMTEDGKWVTFMTGVCKLKK